MNRRLIWLLTAIVGLGAVAPSCGSEGATTIRAAFIYVGFHPNTEYLQGLLELDAGGHVCTDIHMRTKIPGVYACGDARAESTRQLGAAVGDGITAALAAFHDLST